MTAATFQILPFDPATGDYEALAALWTAQYPDMPRQAEIWRGRDAEPHPGIEPWGRFIAMDGDTLLGMAEFCGCPTAGEPGQLQFGFAHAPGSDVPAVLDALMEALASAVAPHRPPVLVGYARDNHGAMIDLYERHGFAAAQQTASSELRAPFGTGEETARARALLAAQGCELVSASTLATEDPDWARPYHALEVAVVRDIPFLGPVHDETLEQFLERVEVPDRFHPAATFVARERERGALVGVSLLHVYEQIPGYAFAGLTGVLPAWRRRGIGRALKLATLGFARAYGIRRIVALNDVDNPMLGLNEALGFERQHVQLTMMKRLDGGGA